MDSSKIVTGSSSDELNFQTGPDPTESQRQLREMDREQMVFGQRLLELRRALGWTQRMAAVELGVSVRTMKKIETLRRSVALGSPPRNL